MYNYSRPLCRHSLNTHAEARQRAAAQKADAFPPAAGPGEDCSSSLTWPAKVAPDGAPETLNKAPATRQKGALQAVNEIDLHETHVNQWCEPGLIRPPNQTKRGVASSERDRFTYVHMYVYMYVYWVVWWPICIVYFETYIILRDRWWFFQGWDYPFYIGDRCNASPFTGRCMWFLPKICSTYAQSNPCDFATCGIKF